MRLIESDRQPNEYSASQLIWTDTNEGGKPTVVARDEAAARVSCSADDLPAAVIDYRLPVEKFSNLAEYDPASLPRRTKSDLSARCGGTSMNFVARRVRASASSARGRGVLLPPPSHMNRLVLCCVMLVGLAAAIRAQERAVSATITGHVVKPEKLKSDDGRVKLSVPAGFVVTKFAEGLGKPRSWLPATAQRAVAGHRRSACCPDAALRAELQCVRGAVLSGR